jgi:hypothetical protein
MLRICLLVLAAVLLAGCSSAPQASGPSDNLTFDVKMDKDGGTMHYASVLTIRLRGAKPLVMKSDVNTGGGVMAPLPNWWHRLDNSTFLVLGWSSWGGGMQTNHALLIAKVRDSLKLVDELEVETDRGSAGLLICVDKDDPRIGIPEPPIHEHPGDWHVSAGKRQALLDEMRNLPYAILSESEADLFSRHEGVNRGKTDRFCYTPPFFSDDVVDRKVAWFRIIPNGFEWPAGK